MQFRVCIDVQIEIQMPNPDDILFCPLPTTCTQRIRRNVDVRSGGVLGSQPRKIARAKGTLQRNNSLRGHVGDTRLRSMAIVSREVKERLRNSAASFMAICFLCCGMLHLEDWFVEKTSCVPVVSDHSQDFANRTPARPTLNMDDEIDRLPNLRFDVGESCLGMVSHDQIGETMEGLFGRIRMDRCQRTGVARVEGIKQGPRFDSAYFTQNNPIRSPAQSRLQKIVEGDSSLERVCLAFNGEYVRLLDPQFGRIFDDDDALLLRNRLSENVEKRSLPGTSSTADKQSLAVRNLLAQIVRELAE